MVGSALRPAAALPHLLAARAPQHPAAALLATLPPQLDPDKRISPKDALRHPFIKDPPAK